MSAPASKNIMSSSGVNLLPAAYRRSVLLRRRTMRWAVLVVFYTLVLALGCLAAITAQATGSNEVSASLEKASNQIAEQTRTISSLRPELTETQTRLSVARTVGEQPDWSVLMSLVGSTMDEEMVLNSVRVDVPTGGSENAPVATKGRASADNGAALTLTLNGLARNQPAVAQFVLRLERLGLFDRVNLRSSGRQAIDAGEVSAFRVECVIGSPPAPHGSPGARAAVATEGGGR